MLCLCHYRCIEQERGLPAPDIVIFMDIDPEMAALRSNYGEVLVKCLWLPTLTCMCNNACVCNIYIYTMYIYIYIYIYVYMHINTQVCVLTKHEQSKSTYSIMFACKRSCARVHMLTSMQVCRSRVQVSCTCLHEDIRLMFTENLAGALRTIRLSKGGTRQIPGPARGFVGVG